MDFQLILVLALATFCALVGFALWSASRADTRFDRNQASRLSLQKDRSCPSSVKASHHKRRTKIEILSKKADA